MPTTTIATSNPYWDAVRNHIDPTGSLWRTPTTGGFHQYRTPTGDLDIEAWHRNAPKRSDLVAKYSWTITSPQTVAFVAQHSQGRIVDPMAGTGWWMKLLTDSGVNCVWADRDPHGNRWHKDATHHLPIPEAEGVDTAAAHPDRTLLLAWPPYDTSDGADILNAYRGQRVIYIGEPEGCACGDDAMFQTFGTDWEMAAEHIPVQWDGLHDVVRVYDRRTVAAPTSPAA